MKKYLLKILFLSFSITFSSYAQTSIAPSAVPSGFDMSGHPQWAKDLRRGEIVAFGSFPFTFFFTSFFMDSYRTATHNWDQRYAPWPFKPAGAINMTQDEQLMTIGIAAGGAVVIALVDHLIVRYRRGKEEQQILGLPPGTPIISRRPLDSEENTPEDLAPSEETDKDTANP